MWVETLSSGCSSWQGHRMHAILGFASRYAEPRCGRPIMCIRRLHPGRLVLVGVMLRAMEMPSFLFFFFAAPSRSVGGRVSAGFPRFARLSVCLSKNPAPRTARGRSRAVSFFEIDVGSFRIIFAPVSSRKRSEFQD